MKRILTTLLLTICFWYTAFAQDKALDKAAQNGNALPTQITVRENVSAQAVLIPQVDARRIFGKEIANNYAVIEVNVGNKSPDAALIIHGVFIDYSRWALSGSTPGAARIDGDPRDRFYAYQASTSTNHVASEEYRVVRGQLLDAQNSTWRNRIMRWLTLAGNLASAYTFALNETGIIQGIASATGVGIPGVATAFPDATIEQLNRVSDFGYKANTVIPKQGAEVIVCFFPIHRFLTPGFQKLFLKSPALFFAPLQMLVDTKIQRDVATILGDELGMEATTLRADVEDQNRDVLGILRNRLPCYVRIARRAEAEETPLVRMMNQSADGACLRQFGLEEKRDEKTVIKTDEKGFPIVGLIKNDEENKRRFASFLALDYLGRVSLNNVSVTIDGVMTVDITTIPGKIDDIAFDSVTNCGDDKKECFWADPGFAGGIRTGTIPGSYLTGASVTIAEASSLGLTEVKTITDGSTDQELHFSFKMTRGILTGTKLHFKVTKPKPGVTGTTIDSQPWIYVVDYSLGPPSITKAELADSTVTVTGSGFFDGPAPNSLTVKLRAPSGELLENLKLTSSDHEKLVFNIPDGKKIAGCWVVLVSVGAQRALPPQNGVFLVKPSPTLESAERDGPNILVLGEDLIETEGCGGEALSFQLVKGTEKPIAVPDFLVRAPNQVLLRVPPAAKAADATWKVQVLLGGKDVSKSPIPLTVKPK
jgi:hypothetical protein